MPNIDRHIAIWGGWVAGPAFGVAMMAAPEVFHLKPVLAGYFFWGGIIIFAITVFVVAALLGRERERGRKAMWPILTMAIGLLIFGVGAAGYFWPEGRSEVAEAAVKQPQLEILFESKPPYETSEVKNANVSNAVRIGLRASGKALSNCKVYVEKLAPEPRIAGGLPILLDGGGFVLRPDDPEKLVEIAHQWGNSNQFRFSAPTGGGFFAETLNFLPDNIALAVEIKVVCTELQKTALFRIWTDKSKKLHLQPM